MKAFVALLLLLYLTPCTLSACGFKSLNTSAAVLGNSGFQKDCDLQKRYLRLREIFSKYGRDIENVTRYRALRFIAIEDYEENLKGRQLSPNLIYSPAPITWDIWSMGVDEVIQTFTVNGDILARASGELEGCAT